MDWREHIELNPAVLVGKPVLRGTRLSVEHVLDMLAAGVSEEEILANHPRLTREGVRACLAYATALVRGERVFPLSA
ncbi:MAG: DUF433 domain-containing protein [Deltaproteobacteria bacterium]|nr:DUF433 domain-containing protein [Deltaproteobacteria bacterium]